MKKNEFFEIFLTTIDAGKLLYSCKYSKIRYLQGIEVNTYRSECFKYKDYKSVTDFCKCILLYLQVVLMCKKNGLYHLT